MCRLEIGTENDVGSDYLILQKNGGYVVIHKTLPIYNLDINGTVGGSVSSAFKTSIGCYVCNSTQGANNVFQYEYYNANMVPIFTSYNNNGNFTNMYLYLYLYALTSGTSYPNCNNATSATANSAVTYVTAPPNTNLGNINGIDFILIMPNFGIQVYSGYNFDCTCYIDCFNNTSKPIPVQPTSANGKNSLRLVYGGTAGNYTQV